MQWDDEGIVIHTKIHGERSMLISLLTRSHGRAKGLFMARSKSHQSIQLGTLVNAHWQARLAEHLGRFQLESVFSPFSKIVNSNDALLSLTAACAWVEMILPEHEPHPMLFEAMVTFLKNMGEGNVFLHYLHFEQQVLRATGLELSLDRCAATGQAHDLAYISPKTGRAVSREAGLPYHDKLLALPSCLRAESHGSPLTTSAELAVGFSVIEYFLEHFVLHVHNLKMPSARARLSARIGQSCLKDTL